jgi:hypothetical protein
MKRKEKTNDVRNFSLALAAILAGIGAVRLYRGLSFPYPFMALGAAVAVLGLTLKSVMRPIYKGGMFFADKMSWVVTRVVLTIVYFCVFAPYGLFFRIIRKDLLDRHPHPERPTYWMERIKAPYEPKRSERMF